MNSVLTAVNLLSNAADYDDLSFHQIVSHARRLNFPEGLEQRVEAIVTALIVAGLIPVDSPSTNESVYAWPNMSKSLMTSKIMEAWKALDRNATILDVCWFHKP